MSFTPSTPVTGAAVTGLTSPTYTLTADTAPAVNAKQYYVSALGGTQTGVTTHSVSSPFVVAMWRPLVLQGVAFFSSLIGFKAKNPVNRYKYVVLKGATPAAGATPQNIVMSMSIEVPAGVENYDAVNMKAAFSLLAGVVFANGTGMTDVLSTGTL